MKSFGFNHQFFIPHSSFFIKRKARYSPKLYTAFKYTKAPLKPICTGA